MPVVSDQCCASVLHDPIGQLLDHNPAFRTDLNVLPLLINLGRRQRDGLGVCVSVCVSVCVCVCVCLVWG